MTVFWYLLTKAHLSKNTFYKSSKNFLNKSPVCADCTKTVLRIINFTLKLLSIYLKTINIAMKNKQIPIKSKNRQNIDINLHCAGLPIKIKAEQTRTKSET